MFKLNILVSSGSIIYVRCVYVYTILIISNRDPLKFIKLITSVRIHIYKCVRVLNELFLRKRGNRNDQS